MTISETLLLDAIQKMRNENFQPMVLISAQPHNGLLAVDWVHPLSKGEALELLKLVMQSVENGDASSLIIQP